MPITEEEIMKAVELAKEEKRCYTCMAKAEKKMLIRLLRLLNESGYSENSGKLQSIDKDGALSYAFETRSIELENQDTGSMEFITE
jgi:hypothetical protein